MISRKIAQYIHVTALVVVLVIAACVQSSEANEPTTSGRDFRFAFLPTLHSPGLYDSLHVIVQGTEPTSGGLMYTNRLGQEIALAFSLQAPDYTWSHAIFWEELELQGIHGLDNDRAIKWFDDAHKPNVMGQARNESARVTIDTDQPPVEVFVGTTLESKNRPLHPERDYFTGADYTQVLPTEMLGKEYIVTAWPSDFRVHEGNNSDLTSGTPSHFAVVALYNNTQIRAELSDPNGLFWSANTVVQRTLQAGQVAYFAANLVGSSEADLSGTIVTANNPIAVFAGHVAAEVPSRNSFGTNNLNPLDETRDPMVIQNLPVEMTGQTFVCAPLIPAADDGEQSDRLLLVGGLEQADVFVNGVAAATLAPNATQMMRLDSPVVIEASDSIAIVAAAGSGSVSGSWIGAQKTGDPFLVALADASTWPTTATWTTPHLYEANGADLFAEHHVLLASPADRLSRIFLNGVDVSSQFIDIDGNYALFQTTVDAGRNTVVADTGVMVVAYGFGTACSYGFNVGRHLREVPVLRPITATLTTVEHRAAPGDRVEFPIVLNEKDFDVRWFANGELTLTGTMSWNATLLYPENVSIDSIVDGRAYATFSADLSESVQQFDTLASVSMLVGLGNALVDEVTMANVQVYTSLGIPLLEEQQELTVEGSLMYLDGVWMIDGKPRLVNSIAGSLDADVAPNPATQNATLTFRNVDAEVSLYLYDNLGRVVADFSAQLQGQPQSGSIVLDFAAIPRGTYMLRLSSGQHTVARLVVLE